MRIIRIERNGAPLSVEDAWAFHNATRERTAPRNGPETIRQKTELQRILDDYRRRVQAEFGIDLLQERTPDTFSKPTSRFFEHPSGESRGYTGKEEGRRWYHELEVMRSQELGKHFERALQGVELPHPAESHTLHATDVGSRSGYFSALMDRDNRAMNGTKIDWKAVDIQDPKAMLPVAVSPHGGFKKVEPFTDIPKSDIITLNCVMHHVGEGTRGQFDEQRVDQFIGTVRDSLPPDGLVVMVEDFIGKEKEEPVYRNFIKGLDDLFYPNAPGNQKLSREWVERFEKAGFKLEKEEYPVGFNVVGFPVVETLLVLRKTAA